MNPKLRALEAFPVQNELICLRDPFNITDKMFVVPHDVFFILTLFDGKTSVIDIQHAYTRKYGDLLFNSRVEEIVQQLDSCFFLENERFQQEKERVMRSFREGVVREASHVGSAYEADEEALRNQLEGFFIANEDQANPNEEKVTGYLKGIVAPHIDLRRGGSCFARSYSELRSDSKADIFVILGVSHVETHRRFVLTRKDFDTPLGRMRTDQDFVDGLSKAGGDIFFDDEFVHRNEHSIEFQVLFLQYLFPHKQVKVVPILCSSLHRMIYDGQDPMQDEEMRLFIERLKTLILQKKQSVCCIAGVDLSHIGKRFGQSITLSSSVLEEIENEDRRMLQTVIDGDGNNFFRHIQNERDRRNVCGVPAIYTLLQVIGAKSARLLKYEKSVEENTQSVVTFAGMSFYGD